MGWYINIIFMNIYEFSYINIISCTYNKYGLVLSECAGGVDVYRAEGVCERVGGGKRVTMEAKKMKYEYDINANMKTMALY